MRLEHGEHLAELRLGGLAVAELRGEDRDVEVDAPLVDAAPVQSRGEREREIVEADERSVGAAANGLVQIDRLGEAGEAFELAAGDAQGAGDVGLRDAHAGLGELAQRRHGALKLDGVVAAIEADPQMAREVRRQAQLVEEPDHLVAGLEHAARLGLERERDRLAALLRDGVEALERGDEVRARRAPVAAVLEAERHGGYDALAIFAKPDRQDAGEARGVVEALRAAPVGEIGPLLDVRAVEVAEGEAVD